MDSSVSLKDKNWFLRVCHHISTGLYASYENVIPLNKQIFGKMPQVLIYVKYAIFVSAQVLAPLSNTPVDAA